LSSFDIGRRRLRHVDNTGDESKLHRTCRNDSKLGHMTTTENRYEAESGQNKTSKRLLSTVFEQKTGF
jgi:hypothetical protein